MNALTTQVQSSDTFNGFMQTSGGSYCDVIPIPTACTTTTNIGYSTSAQWYPYGYTYYNWCGHSNDNRTEKAYQVIRALMKAKVLTINSLPKFLDAMDEVVKAL
jgi:hypothetical protein